MAPFWILGSLSAVHWQARSSAPQDVVVFTVWAMQSVAQEGICAVAKPAIASRARCVNEYCILRDVKTLMTL